MLKQLGGSVNITTVQSAGRMQTARTAAFTMLTSTPVHWDTWYTPAPCCFYQVSLRLYDNNNLTLKTTETICGPWIPDDGKIFTHTISTAGKMTQTNWTAKVDPLSKNNLMLEKSKQNTFKLLQSILNIFHSFPNINKEFFRT